MKHPLVTSLLIQLYTVSNNITKIEKFIPQIDLPEVLQSARQKVMDSRQKPNTPSINYVISEIDILREDIQEILKRLNPSRKPGMLRKG